MREQQLRAKCGHTDALSYFAATVCAKCAKQGHRRATGRGGKR